MKKRRELDALVNGKGQSSSGGRSTKNGKHELLRNDSDSSEVEEFSMPEKSIVRKRGRSHLCTTCMTVCWAVLLVSCMVTVGGLVWVHLHLKSDVDWLKQQLKTVETDEADTKSQMQEISLAQKEFKIKVLDVERLRTNLSELTKQLAALDMTTKQLGASLAASTEQKSSDDLKVLSKSVADLGSHVETLQEDMQKIKDDIQTVKDPKSTLNDKISNLEKELLLLKTERDSTSHAAVGNQHSDDSKHIDEYLQQEVVRMSGDITAINATIFNHFDVLTAHSIDNLVFIHELQNRTATVEQKLSTLELNPVSSQRLDEAVREAVGNEVAVFRNITTGGSGLSSVQETLDRFETRLDALNLQNVNQNRTVGGLSASVDDLKVTLTQLAGNVTMVKADVVSAKQISDRFNAVEGTIEQIAPIQLDEQRRKFQVKTIANSQVEVSSRPFQTPALSETKAPSVDSNQGISAEDTRGWTSSPTTHSIKRKSINKKTIDDMMTGV